MRLAWSTRCCGSIHPHELRVCTHLRRGRLWLDGRLPLLPPLQDVFPRICRLQHHIRRDHQSPRTSQYSHLILCLEPSARPRPSTATTQTAAAIPSSSDPVSMSPALQITGPHPGALCRRCRGHHRLGRGGRRRRCCSSPRRHAGARNDSLRLLHRHKPRLQPLGAVARPLDVEGRVPASSAHTVVSDVDRSLTVNFRLHVRDACCLQAKTNMHCVHDSSRSWAHLLAHHEHWSCSTGT